MHHNSEIETSFSRKAKSKALSAAASRGYNVAQHWERLAVLSDAQQAAVDLIPRYCGERPVPKHIQDQRVDSDLVAQTTSEFGTQRSDSWPSPDFENAVLQNSAQFHRWYSELEGARSREAEHKFRAHATALQSHMSTCRQLQGKVDETLEFFASLKLQHHQVAAKSRQLHDSCQQLVAEEKALADFTAAVRKKLAYFDELEAIGSRFHGTAAPSVDSDAFLTLLASLDDSLAFVAAHPQYADSAAYAGKFRALQQRALSAVRARVSSVLRHAFEQVQMAVRQGHRSVQRNLDATALNSSSGGDSLPLLAEADEAALLYVRFRAAAEAGLKGLLAGVAKKSKAAEYARLLGDCHITYCEARIGVVAPVARERIAAIGVQPLPAATRAGAAYLMQACQMEHQLHEHFFPPAAEGGASGVEPIMDPLCTLLYDALRPRFILLSRLEDLAELADILQHEVIGEQLKRRGDTTAALRPMLARMLADIRHRLAFRAHAFIKEEVAGFRASPEDLDYPAVLQPTNANGAEQQPSSSPPESSLSSPSVSQDEQQQQQKQQQQGRPKEVAVWWPPVGQALRAVGLLYGALDSSTFGGVAQDCIAAATASVQSASRAVAKRSGPMDGQLFQVRQLLVLREGIAPFQADFTSVDRVLDFSHLRDQLRRIAGAPAALFRLGSDNAVMGLVSRAGPRVLESQVDSKKELERALKAACEAYIMAVTKITVDVMLSFITKVTAVKVASSSRPLRDQAFATPARLAEVSDKVREAMSDALPAAVAKMRVYLHSPTTHAVLLKPIKANVREAHQQIALILEDDYSQEERDQIRLTSSEELSSVLDNL